MNASDWLDPVREFLLLSRNYAFFILFVIIFIGWGLPYIYILFESLLWRVVLGPSSIGKQLRADAIRDFRKLLLAQEKDRGVTRPAAVLFAIPFRLASLRDYTAMLRRLRKEEAENLYRNALENLADAWRQGLQTSVLLDYLEILRRVKTHVKKDRLLGRVIAANVTYLLGDLENGHRMAREIMTQAHEYDTEVGAPFFKWLVSYALWNSRLFMGEFESAANELGDLWRTCYAQSSAALREQLHDFYRANRSTLDPVASVPRHIILASALNGAPIITEWTRPIIPDDATTGGHNDAWAEIWYRLGTWLCSTEEISLHFTHAYMALYCIVVEQRYDVPKLLDAIPADAPMVSLYVKHGMLGLHHFEKRNYREALKELREADANSGISGNRFFECIFAPIQAAAAARVATSLHPEIRALMRRARKRAQMSPNNFYTRLISAADTVIAAANEEEGKRDHLLARTKRLVGGHLTEGFVKIFHLEDISKPAV